MDLLERLTRAAVPVQLAPLYARELQRRCATVQVSPGWPHGLRRLQDEASIAYLGGRLAPLGEPPTALAASALFVYPDWVVSDALRELTSVGAAAIWQVRMHAAVETYSRLLGPADQDVEEVVWMLEDLFANVDTAGRPIFGALVGLGWPRAQWSRVWYGLELLAEHRMASCHLGATGQLNGPELLALRAHRSWIAPEDLLRELGWSDTDVVYVLDGLAGRRLLSRGVLSDDGEDLLREIEFNCDRAQRELRIRLNPASEHAIARIERWGETLLAGDVGEDLHSLSAQALAYAV